MEYAETIQGIENKRTDLLHRLRQVMINNPASFGDHSKAIGIQRNTLKSFIDGKAISLITFLKIQKYVKGKE